MYLAFTYFLYTQEHKGKVPNERQLLGKSMPSQSVSLGHLLCHITAREKKGSEVMERRRLEQVVTAIAELIIGNRQMAAGSWSD